GLYVLGGFPGNRARLLRARSRPPRDRPLISSSRMSSGHDHQAADDACSANEPGHDLAKTDVLLDEEDGGDQRHPRDVHQPEDREHRHQRPTAAEAVKTM